MTAPMVGGYDPDLQINLSIRQDFPLLLEFGNNPDGTAVNALTLFPVGTVIDLRFYANKADVVSGNEIDGTAIRPVLTEQGVLIRIESPIADKIPAKAEARLTVTYPSEYPNGDNLPWAKCRVTRDD